MTDTAQTDSGPEPVEYGASPGGPGPASCGAMLMTNNKGASKKETGAKKTGTEEASAEEVRKSEIKYSTAAFEEALAKSEDSKYVLHLYVAGMGPKFIQAIDNIKRIFEEYMPGKYQLEIIDIYQSPVFAKDGQIVAAPTLIKELPPPLRKLIGSMKDTERVLVGMDLKCKNDKE